MIPPPTRTTIVIGALSGLTLGFFIGRHRPPVPASVEVTHDRTVRAESIATRVDTVVRTKTKTLTKTLAQYDTVRDSVRITDTVVVKEFIERCDAIRQACDDYKTAAIAKFAADSAVIRAKTQEIKALLAARPSTLGQLSKYALVGLAGYGVGRLSVGVHLPLP